MDYFDSDNREEFQRVTGFNVQLRGQEWLPLRNDMRAMVASRLSAVSWIPRGAIAAILAVPEQNTLGRPGILVPIPFPTTTGFGTPSPDAPEWIDTGSKRIWWDNFVEAINVGERAFNQKQWAAGQTAMRRAQSNATMWTTAYNIARVLGAPVALIESSAQRFLSSATGLVVLVGGAAIILHKLGAFKRAKIKTNPGRRSRLTYRKGR